MNDIVVFLILAGIALVFKWLGSVRETEAPPPKQASAPNELPRSLPADRPPAVSEQERVRRFLEALGAPPGSAPPPPVRPRQAVPPRRVATPPPQRTPPKVKRTWTQPLPPLVTVPEAVEAPRFPLPDPIFTPPVVTVTAPPAPPILPLVRPNALRAALPAPPPLLSLGELLRSPGSARQAIILREVLGPPRGLQPIMGESGFAKFPPPVAASA